MNRYRTAASTEFRRRLLSGNVFHDFLNNVWTGDVSDGSDDREIELPIGQGRTLKFPGETFLKAFSLPNFFFHVTMTYALLRQGGVDDGKMDYLGAP